MKCSIINITFLSIIICSFSPYSTSHVAASSPPSHYITFPASPPVTQPTPPTSSSTGLPMSSDFSDIFSKRFSITIVWLKVIVVIQ